MIAARRRAPRIAGLIDTVRSVPSAKSLPQFNRGPTRSGPATTTPPGPGGQHPRLEAVEVAIRGAQLIAAQPLVKPVGQGLLPGSPPADLGGQERIHTHSANATTRALQNAER